MISTKSNAGSWNPHTITLFIYSSEIGSERNCYHDLIYQDLTRVNLPSDFTVSGEKVVSRDIFAVLDGTGDNVDCEVEDDLKNKLD